MSTRCWLGGLLLTLQALGPTFRTDTVFLYIPSSSSRTRRRRAQSGLCLLGGRHSSHSSHVTRWPHAQKGQEHGMWNPPFYLPGPAVGCCGFPPCFLIFYTKWKKNSCRISYKVRCWDMCLPCYSLQILSEEGRSLGRKTPKRSASLEQPLHC